MVMERYGTNIVECPHCGYGNCFDEQDRSGGYDELDSFTKIVTCGYCKNRFCVDKKTRQTFSFNGTYLKIELWG